MPLDEQQRRAENLRARGRLAEAASVYQAILSANPGDLRARRFLSCVGHLSDAPPADAPGLQMAPFAVVPDFLEQPERDEAFSALSRTEHAFESSRVVYQPASDAGPAGVGPVAAVDTTVRDALAARNLSQLISAEWVARFEHALAERFFALSCVLGVPHFEVGHYELQATAFGNGGFFLRHHDNHGGTARRITALYQLHHKPARFTGGDLQLFDTDVCGLRQGERPLESARYTRLKTSDNQLILFPSDYIHSVSLVRSKSAAFADARFTITAWLHA